MKFQTAVLLTMICLGGAGSAKAFSGVENGYLSQGCNAISTNCGTLGDVVNHVPSWSFSTPTYALSGSYTAFGNTQYYQVQTQLSADVGPGIFRGSSTSEVVIDNPSPDSFARQATASSQLLVSTVDSLQIISNSMPVGSEAVFSYTAVLHSEIAGNLTAGLEGPCSAGYAAALAGLHIETTHANGAGTNAFRTDFRHSSCGDGSNFMTESQVFHVNVGETLQIATTYKLTAEAYWSQPGSASESVDMSHTAYLVLESLTPGVTFSSESGYSYLPPAAVPEPGTFFMMVTGLVALFRQSAGRKRRAECPRH